MTYASDLLEPNRDFVNFVIITLDRCSLTYGIAPCTASGGQCSYSFATCEDLPNYTPVVGGRDYKFSTKGGAQILKGQQIYPLLTGISPITEEIDPENSKTIDAREELTFDDDPNPPPFDHDKGTGKFHAGITSTFWRLLLARNPNWKFRKIKIYEGKPSYTEGEFKLKFSGIILNIETGQGGAVRVTATTNLKRLKNTQIPNGVSTKNVLTADINASTTTIPVFDGSEFKLLDNGYAAYIKIEDKDAGSEYLKLTGIAGNNLTVVRSGLWGTSSAAHLAGVRVLQVASFASESDTGAESDIAITPIEAVKRILLGWVGLDAADVDTAGMDLEAASWITNFRVRRVIENPTEAEKLLSQIRFLTFGSIWQDLETQKITFRTIHPIDPHQTPTVLTDANAVLENSIEIDRNHEAQVTRLFLAYAPNDIWGLKDHNSFSDFLNKELWVNFDAENAANYNDIIEKAFFSDWIYRQVDALAVSARYSRRFASPPAIIFVSVDKSQAAIKTGDIVTMQIPEIVDQTGAAKRNTYQVLYKKERDDGRIDLKLLETKEEKRYAFIAHNGTPNYLSAPEIDDITFKDRRHAFITTNAGTMSNGDKGYFIY